MDYSPLGESTTFRYGNCQARYFENMFPTCMLNAIYSSIICEFAGQRQPNLLPVAGGGCANPHSKLTVS